jgi:NAD(P)-dependent dehydrogenase (short-subunit alcohol dehydrogenase family)
LRAATDRIDVLVNNAGGSFTGPVITEDGFERTFQVNYVAGFLLTLDLMEILTASQGAVVNTSSRAATKGTVDLGDLDGRQRFKTYRAYQDVKLASTLHIRELHARYHDQGLSAMAFNPGFIGGTSVGAEPFPILTRFNRAPLTWIFPSLSWGGARLAYFAEGTPGQAWQSGCYYRDDHRLRHTAKQAYDPQLSRQLWDTTIELLAHQGIVFAG